MLIHHFLEYYARNFPDSPFLTRDGKSVSYGEANRQANLLANGMLNLGIGKGQRVSILGENSLEHLILLIAAGKIGAITVPLNIRLAPVELVAVLNDADARLLLAMDKSMQDKLQAIRSELPQGCEVIASQNQWTDWLQQQQDSQPAINVAPDDAFMQVYTSGTTGTPKGVVSSHRNVVTECQMNTSLMNQRPGPGSADLVCAPFFHVGGTGWALMSIFSGTEIILHSGFNAAAVVTDIERYPIHSIFMVPAMINEVLQLPGIEQQDFSNLNYIVYGASPITEPVLRRALDVFKVDFIQMYGMTETTGTVLNLSPEDHRLALQTQPHLLKSCGRPSVSVQIKVVDESGNELPAKEVGELWIKSPTNMKAYHNLPEETASSITNGWVHTGDACYLDEQGYVYLEGRIKDMVISGGENIYPNEVENVLAHHSAIHDVAVIGIPDKKFGEALLAFVELKPDMSLNTDEMIAFCRGRIAGYKIPRQLQVIEEIPRNPSGKILKRELRESFWSDVRLE